MFADLDPVTGFYGTMTIDLEQPTDNVTGDDNEGAVAATLWPSARWRRSIS